MSETTFEEISAADFFYRNRDIAGFTNPARAVFSSIRELIENSLDATEQVSILPDIYIRLSYEDEEKFESELAAEKKADEKEEEEAEVFESGVYRLRIEDNGSGVPESASLQGVVLNTWFGGTFQFDLAALLPGDWTHVVTLLSPSLQYAWFSRAVKGQAWMFEADNGENFNGWKFLGSYFLGYKMPLALELAGLLLETEQNIGYVHELSTTASGGWGSDFLLLTLSPVLNFRLTEHSTLAVLFQFRRERLYTSDTVFYAYYANRKYSGTYWDFYRIAFSYSLEL